MLPYFLDNVCVRKTQGGACEKPLLYKQNLLEVGDQYYVDRTFTLQNSIPTELKDGRWLMTADDDKNLSNSDYLSFNTSQTAAVYVAYDAAAAAIPNWLTAFSPLGIQLQTNNGSSPLLNVYKWDNVIGDVELGGADAVSTGARTNYLVIVVPK